MDRSLSIGLLNGGFGGLFWVFIATVTCYSSVVASLAEMESMEVNFFEKTLAASQMSASLTLTP